MLPTPTIHVARELRPRVAPSFVRALESRTRRAGQALAIGAPRWSTLGLRIVGDAEMADLHLRFMGEAGPTDVLSFSPEELEPALLGDIVLDWDAVLRQAGGVGSRAWLDEATVLVVHGLAHLLGHDHRDRQEGRAMFALEQRVLRRLGLAAHPRPYAPRLLSARERA